MQKARNLKARVMLWLYVDCWQRRTFAITCRHSMSPWLLAVSNKHLSSLSSILFSTYLRTTITTTTTTTTTATTTTTTATFTVIMQDNLTVLAGVRVKNWMILLEQCFTACMLLLAAASAFKFREDGRVLLNNVTALSRYC